MGKAIDLVRAFAPEHAAVLDDLKDQLLIVLLKRLGGSIDVPVAEVDDTAQDMMSFSLDPETQLFHFEIRKKS